jgi:hypothetical protein
MQALRVQIKASEPVLALPQEMQRSTRPRG